MQKKALLSRQWIPVPVRRLLIQAWHLATDLVGLWLALAISPVIRFMARTGAGTDACLQRDCLPMPVHYYSPIPDIADLKERRAWDRRSDLTGIDFCGEAQVALLKELGGRFGHECDWPPGLTEDPYDFYTENSSFSFGCAASTHCLLRLLKPQRVVEIGSGNSSLVISAALRRNAEGARAAAEYTIVDPYPRGMVERGLPGLTRLVRQRVELLHAGFFEQLSGDDVLFIDSGHTVRTGGDVNYLILDVLPRLAPGVAVHFHDIPLPYEYPEAYATNRHFRMFWTEAYLLQAFLCLNREFEVLLAMQYLMADHNEAFRAAFPSYDPARHLLGSGSFWIRRRPMPGGEAS